MKEYTLVVDIVFWFKTTKEQFWINELKKWNSMVKADHKVEINIKMEEYKIEQVA